MNLRESAGVALAALRANKLRSFLTLLGVIIGVSSVIAVMSLVQGLNQYVAKQLMSSGSNVFSIDKIGIVFDHRGFGERLKRPDITREQARLVAQGARHAAAVVAERSAGATLRRGSRSLRAVIVRGVEPGYMVVNDLPVGRGRPLGESDELTRAPVCVLGADVADELFGSVDPIGREVRLGAHRLTVVGVGERKGSAFGQSRDLYALIPLSLQMRLWGRFGSLEIQVRSRTPEEFEQAQDEARALMRLARRLRPGEENDFEIVTPEMLMSLWKNLSGALFAVIVGVSLISLLVGGVVIMNIMLVSVTERTKEIGIRKALGARRKAVLAQFLLEAVVLCNFGGVLGVLLGFALGNLVTIFTGFPIHVPVEWAVNGLLFCTTVGLTFGMWPAMKASRLAPIEALRWE